MLTPPNVSLLRRAGRPVAFSHRFPMLYLKENAEPAPSIVRAPATSLPLVNLSFRFKPFIMVCLV